MRASAASPSRAARAPGPLRRGLGQLVQPARAVGLDELHEAADDLAADDDLGEAHHARELDESPAALGVLGEVDLLVLEAALLEQGLGPRAERARIGRVDRDVRG